MKRKDKFSIIGLGFLILLIGILALLPLSKIYDPVSKVVLASDGSLLGAKTAKDEQWRFPKSDSIPDKFKKALISYEDRRFYHHHGIDIIRIVKSLFDNLRENKIISGASTINMQLARIYRKNPERSIVNKLFEMCIALKTDLVLGKEEILKEYISNAPFGGNVVGLEAAAWRYYFKPAADLSWAECATLAVLPNNPSMIHPNKNREQLKVKRNALLSKLFKYEIIDREMYELSLLEELPGRVYALPREAPHFLERLDRQEKQRKWIHSTIQKQLQYKVNHIVENHREILEMNGIHNMAVLVIDNIKNEVISYVGNTTKKGKVNHEHFVDMIESGRSSGSILKPILYMAAVDEGMIAPGQFLPDIPGRISGYRPRNFNRGYEGLVYADQALAKSLNIPFVYLLQSYTIDKFLKLLNSFGFSTFKRNADHYGLPLVLGGGDVKLWDLLHVYSSMARTLNTYKNNQMYRGDDWKVPATNMKSFGEENSYEKDTPIHFSAASIWLGFQAMTQLERPGELGEWERYQGSRKIAWKTGTSFKFKDAWSVGVSPEYSVGVWVGNAAGEGRPGLIGVKAAAPVLFDVFSILGTTTWFDEPSNDLKEITVCKDSGFPASSFCSNLDTVPVPLYSKHKKLCPYHQVVLVDREREYSYNSECNISEDIEAKKYFVLPPLEEHYYSLKHPEYELIPTLHPDCRKIPGEAPSMALIYPNDLTQIHIPVEFDGNKGRVVFRLTHKDPLSTIYWYIEDELVETTKQFHEIEILKEPGSYKLFILDDKGEELIQYFQILE